MSKVAIKNEKYQIIAWQEDISNGDIRLTDFYGKILGYYRKKLDITENDKYQIVGHGNLLGTLIPKNWQR